MAEALREGGLLEFDSGAASMRCYERREGKQAEMVEEM